MMLLSLPDGARKRPSFQLAIKADKIAALSPIQENIRTKAFSNPDTTYISHVDSKLKGLRPLYSHQHTGNKVAVADASEAH